MKANRALFAGLMGAVIAVAPLQAEPLAGEGPAVQSSGQQTVDSVTAGQEAGERDHNLQGDKMETRVTGGSMTRFANSNGWFSYDLQVRTNGTQYLTVQYAGSGAAAPSSVDVLVGTNKLGTKAITAGDSAPAAVSYALGARMIRSGKVTVKFQATADARTPGIASLRVTTPEPTTASLSTVSSPRTNYGYIANFVKDLREPLSSGENINVNPNAKAHFDWWPQRATNTWIQYDFAKPAKVSACEVYWFDDSANRGGCRPPKSWTVLYHVNGEWKPVTNANGMGVEKDKYNRASFDVVETDGLRLDVLLPDNNSSGILQWKVE